MNKKRNAFTLAETLITLMIIGIVAAVVLPSLLDFVNEDHLKNSYKKTYATLDQAVRILKTNKVQCSVRNSADLATCMNNVIKGTITDYQGKNSGTKNVIQLPNGTAIQFFYRMNPNSNGAKTISGDIRSICGTDERVKRGQKQSIYSGSTARCSAIVDLNGFSQGTENLATYCPEYYGSGFWCDFGSGNNSYSVSGYQDNGTDIDIQYIILTGESATPYYQFYGNNGDAKDADLNQGYQWMYGEGKQPE